jgi:hypothetical protein
MIDYTAIQTQAQELLTEFGQRMTIEYEQGGKMSVVGVFVSQRKQSQSTGFDTVITNQREVVIQGKMSKKPSVGSYLTANSIRYFVAEVEEISPTKTTLLYRLVLAN